MTVNGKDIFERKLNISKERRREQGVEINLIQ